MKSNVLLALKFGDLPLEMSWAEFRTSSTLLLLFLSTYRCHQMHAVLKGPTTTKEKEKMNKTTCLAG